MSPANAQNGTAPLPRLPEGPSPERMRGPVEIGGAPPWPALVALALVVLLAAAVLIWWIRRRRRGADAPRVPPGEAALEELRNAAALTRDDDARFCTLASLALRRYLEDGHGIPALGHTTGEVRGSVTEAGLLDPGEASRLTAFLERCDSVKFGRDRLGEGEREALAEEGRALVERCGSAAASAGNTPDGGAPNPNTEAAPR